MLISISSYVPTQIEGPVFSAQVSSLLPDSTFHVFVGLTDEEGEQITHFNVLLLLIYGFWWHHLIFQHSRHDVTKWTKKKRVFMKVWSYQLNTCAARKDFRKSAFLLLTNKTLKERAESGWKRCSGYSAVPQIQVLM